MSTISDGVAIEVRSVSKEYAQRSESPVRAVDDVSLTIAPGEIVAVLGPNGAGKTTLLDMVLGLIEPTAGSARVFGLAPRQAVAGGRVSAVLQSGGLLRDLTVLETIRMIASTHAEHRPIEEVVERAGLAKIADRAVSKCSGGEQQRLRFAVALLPDPDLLILDEPTAGMDVSARRAFWAVMHAEADEGRTVVFATHYLAEADTFADRIVLMRNGRVIADGPTEQIRAAAADRTVIAQLPDTSPEAIERLRGAPGVADLHLDGDHVTIRATDSDAVARLLLNDLAASDLQIATANLEEAFIVLTADQAESPS